MLKLFVLIMFACRSSRTVSCLLEVPPSLLGQNIHWIFWAQIKPCSFCSSSPQPVSERSRQLMVGITWCGHMVWSRGMVTWVEFMLVLQ